MRPHSKKERRIALIQAGREDRGAMSGSAGSEPQVEMPPAFT